jgi:hypothetical protein
MHYKAKNRQLLRCLKVEINYYFKRCHLIKGCFLHTKFKYQRPIDFECGNYFQCFIPNMPSLSMGEWSGNTDGDER